MVKLRGRLPDEARQSPPEVDDKPGPSPVFPIVRSPANTMAVHRIRFSCGRDWSPTKKVKEGLRPPAVTDHGDELAQSDQLGRRDHRRLRVAGRDLAARPKARPSSRVHVRAVGPSSPGGGRDPTFGRSGTRGAILDLTFAVGDRRPEAGRWWREKRVAGMTPWSGQLAGGPAQGARAPAGRQRRRRRRPGLDRQDLPQRPSPEMRMALRLFA